MDGRWDGAIREGQAGQYTQVRRLLLGDTRGAGVLGPTEGPGESEDKDAR